MLHQQIVTGVMANSQIVSSPHVVATLRVDSPPKKRMRPNVERTLPKTRSSVNLQYGSYAVDATRVPMRHNVMEGQAAARSLGYIPSSIAKSMMRKSENHEEQHLPKHAELRGAKWPQNPSREVWQPTTKINNPHNAAPHVSRKKSWDSRVQRKTLSNLSEDELLAVQALCSTARSVY